MSGSKHFEKIAWSVTAIILIVTILFMNGGTLGLAVMTHTMGYENRLFDNTKVHTIDIVMDDWDAFIDNASSEEYYTTDLVIDGETYKNIAIRGKGNTSLSTVSYSIENGKLRISFVDDGIPYNPLEATEPDITLSAEEREIGGLGIFLRWNLTIMTTLLPIMGWIN